MRRCGSPRSTSRIGCTTESSTGQQVLATLERMAVIVDRQNAGGLQLSEHGAAVRRERRVPGCEGSRLQRVNGAQRLHGARARSAAAGVQVEKPARRRVAGSALSHALRGGARHAPKALPTSSATSSAPERSTRRRRGAPSPRRGFTKPVSTSSASGLAVRERHEKHLVAAQRLAIPRAVRADERAAGIARGSAPPCRTRARASPCAARARSPDARSRQIRALRLTRGRRAARSGCTASRRRRRRAPTSGSPAPDRYLARRARSRPSRARPSRAPGEAVRIAQAVTYTRICPVFGSISRSRRGELLVEAVLGDVAVRAHRHVSREPSGLAIKFLVQWWFNEPAGSSKIVSPDR